MRAHDARAYAHACTQARRAGVAGGNGGGLMWFRGREPLVSSCLSWEKGSRDPLRCRKMTAYLSSRKHSTLLLPRDPVLKLSMKRTCAAARAVRHCHVCAGVGGRAEGAPCSSRAARSCPRSSPARCDGSRPRLRSAAAQTPRPGCGRRCTTMAPVAHRRRAPRERVGARAQRVLSTCTAQAGWAASARGIPGWS